MSPKLNSPAKQIDFEHKSNFQGRKDEAAAGGEEGRPMEGTRNSSFLEEYDDDRGALDMEGLRGTVASPVVLPKRPTMRQRGRSVLDNLRNCVEAAVVVYKRIQEERRAGYHLNDSGKYEGSRRPGVKLDRLTRLEVPTWSTSLFIPMENTGMLICALTGVGMCWLHGHTQDGEEDPDLLQPLCQSHEQHRHLLRKSSLSVSLATWTSFRFKNWL